MQALGLLMSIFPFTTKFFLSANFRIRLQAMSNDNGLCFSEGALFPHRQKKTKQNKKD
jgi:hypothetical protein